MKRVVGALFTVCALAVTATPQENKHSSALTSLVATERAFARAAVQKGIYESFLEFFAEDGIFFQPIPIRTRETLLSRPALADRPRGTLNWEPVWADVSAAGDLGYTTGPYTFSDYAAEKRPTLHGHYFSIWKRQADGLWKVAFYLGTQNPEPVSLQRQTLRAARVVRVKQTGIGMSQDERRAALMDLERDFRRETEASGLLKAFLQYLTSESRLHRQQMLPIVGKDAIRAFLSGKALSARWEPTKADVAESDDLGYVYGTYELRDNPSAGLVIEKGYYVRVWKREASGKWKVALDLTHPLLPEQN